MAKTEILLTKQDIPRQWYNIQADLRSPLALPLHPVTNQPAALSDLEAIFPVNIIEQEVSQERWIGIPDSVLDVLAMWRPTPLVRARRLEEALGTPAQIWYKYEGGSPSGSHKNNTAVAQAYFNKIAGTKRLVTETGAGQWGTALSYACYQFGIECQVYMVRVSYDQKPYRRTMMRIWNAEVTPSPSNQTNTGRVMLQKTPDCPGSLGLAISEAIEDTVTHANTKYSLGSVLNHVLLHQTVIGLEAKEQFNRAGIKPDILIGCAGGGSNFAGFTFPFCAGKISGESDCRIVAVEPTACPSLTRGDYRYDFGDTGGMTPLMKMYTLGHDFIPAGIHAGGLRYHGMAPLVSALMNEKVIEARAVNQIPIFEAAVMFARTEGLVAAPETAHAIRVAIDEALEARKDGQPRVIAFIFSGHGLLDLSAYEAYLSGQLQDYEYTPQGGCVKS